MNILDELQERNLIQDISDNDLFKKIKGGDSFYVGFDPTAPSLQIGNLVPLLVCMRLAKAGYKPIILFGGSTGAIGDPSGKNVERQLLDRSEIDSNIKNHMRCVSEIFSRAGVKAEFVNNMQWTENVTTLEFLRDIGKHFTVNYMLSKEVVKNRIEGEGISFTEFSYMILQAFDFLTLYKKHNCKLQIGGSDQWGNITAGLELIRKKAQGEAFAFSMPLITNSQGKKFGKSESGTLWLDSAYTSPYKFHQFWLNLPDADVINYLKIFSFLTMDEISVLEEKLKSEPEKRAAQNALADCMCDLTHGKDATKDAKRSAEVLFGGSIDGLSMKQLEDIFEDAPSSSLPRKQLKEMSFIDLLAETKLAKSKSEARRLVESGGAYINNTRITDVNLKMADLEPAKQEMLVLRSGKKNYHLVKIMAALAFLIIIHIMYPLNCFSQDKEVAVSPKPGWGDFTVVEEKEDYTWWQKTLLWFPNRILDFIDIFRVDVGVGPALGGVIRITKYGQAGYRRMSPASLRFGGFGRNAPFVMESSNEFGIGPGYVKSKDREVCGGEIGAGADLFLVGAYVGFCPEELVDFVGGIFTFDIMDDDFK
jgi:tyrosyl-tRNA synthetase